MTIVVEDTVDENVVGSKFVIKIRYYQLQAHFLAVQDLKEATIASVMDILSEKQKARCDRHGMMSECTEQCNCTAC